MNNRKDIWELYTSSWKVVSSDMKRSLYEQSLSKSCVYTDPLAQTQGWDELESYMLEFHKQVPGGHFVTYEFIEHHDRSMAKWHMVDGKGQQLSEGVSYGEYNGEGKLMSMSGFFHLPD